MGISASHLKTLDYAIVQQCMHCGLCLPTCPTYDATKLERNSPRGRIALMRAVADDRLELSKTFAEEMYFCLGCLACMTACPAGVNYAELFEHARADAEASGVLQAPRRNFIRNFTLRWLFMDLNRLQWFGAILRLYQQLGIQTLIRACGILKLLPKRLRELEGMTPEIRPQLSADLIAPFTTACGERRYRVALLTGCAQDLICSEINRDTAEVLARNGCEVVTPPEQSCCGSLHAHNGEWELAQELARRQIDAFPPDEFDAIISNAGGCGSHLKHYHKLLADDPTYRDRAALWDRKVKDIHEWLMEIGFQAPSPLVSQNFKSERVTSEPFGIQSLDRTTQSEKPLTPALSPSDGEREKPRCVSAPSSERDASQVSLAVSLSPSDGERIGVRGRIVTYHESCHLCHGQKITNQPRQILHAVPGLKLVELPEASWCCGSAGVYNLVQPEMANELLQRKLKHIRSTGASIVATGNPGCLLQIANGAKQAGMDLRVVHPVSLLAEAYRSAQGAGSI